MQFLKSENELDTYVFKVLDEEYQSEISLLNVTHETDTDTIFFYREVFQLLKKVHKDNIRDRSVVRFFNIYMYLDGENIRMGFIFNRDYEEILQTEYDTLIDTDLIKSDDDTQKIIDNNLSILLNNVEDAQKFYTILINVIKDSHRCDEIIRDLQKPQNVLIFSFDYYDDRPLRRSGLFHRDDFGNTKYVSLIFNNETAIYGSEILPSSLCIEHENEQTGRSYFRKNISICRPVLMPSYATVGFNDSLVQHATPCYDDMYAFDNREMNNEYNTSNTLNRSDKRLHSTTPGLLELSEQKRTFIRIWTQTYENNSVLIENLNQNGFVKQSMTIGEFREECQDSVHIASISSPSTETVAVYHDRISEFTGKLFQLNQFYDDNRAEYTIIKSEFIQLRQQVRERKMMFDEQLSHMKQSIADKQLYFDEITERMREDAERKITQIHNALEDMYSHGKSSEINNMQTKMKNVDFSYRNQITDFENTAHDEIMVDNEYITNYEETCNNEMISDAEALANSESEFMAFHTDYNMKQRMIMNEIVANKSKIEMVPRPSYTKYIEQVMPQVSQYLCNTTFNRGGKNRKSKTKLKRVKKRKTRNKK